MKIKSLSMEDLCQVCYSEEPRIFCSLCFFKSCVSCYEHTWTENKNVQLRCIDKTCSKVYLFHEYVEKYCATNDFINEYCNFSFNHQDSINLMLLDKTRSSIQIYDKISNNISLISEINFENFDIFKVPPPNETDREEEHGKKIERRDVICPSSECYGIINNNRCNVCQRSMCTFCKEIMEENHACNKEILETIEIINNSSKECPVCHIFIHKIGGCNSMFCTNCGNSWNYRDGTVYPKTPHNHHNYTVNSFKKVDTTSEIIENMRFRIHDFKHRKIVDVINQCLKNMNALNSYDQVSFRIKKIKKNRKNIQSTNFSLLSDLNIYVLVLYHEYMTIYALDKEQINDVDNLVPAHNVIADVYNKHLFRINADYDSFHFIPKFHSEYSIRYIENLMPTNTLQPIQRRGIQEICRINGVFLNMNTGSGKTMAGLYALWLFLSEFPERYVFIYTLKSVISHWYSQSIDHFGKPLPDNVSVNTYDSLRKLKFDYSKFNGCMILFDEVHVLRNPTIKVNNIALSLASVSLKKITTSATPVHNDLSDLDVIHKICTNHLFSDHHNGDIVDLTQRITIKENNSTDERKDGFPLEKHHDKYFIMDAELQKEYEELQKTLLIPDLFYIKSSKICNRCPSKLEFVLNLIGENNDQQILIYSSFLKNGIDIIASALDILNLKYGKLIGSVSDNARKKMIADYNNEDIKILLISNAGNTGVDLKNTKHFILFDLPWTHAMYTQIIGRGSRYHSHREGEDEINIYKLISIRKEDTAYMDHNFLPIGKSMKPSSDVIKYAIINRKMELMKLF